MAIDTKTASAASSAVVNNNAGKLGLLALIAIVVSSMLGGGVFSLPQNTAESSAVGPVIIAWLIAGVGVYFIANTFRILSDIRPDLQAGVYMYAQEGFGKFIGFNVAWGYWLMTALGNVAFAVILMDAFDGFFPGVFTNGNNLNSIICGSILIWGYNFLVLRGIQSSGFINTVGTIAKLIPLILFVLILGVMIDYSQLFNNFWGSNPEISQVINKKLEVTPMSISSQIFAPLTVTLWAFIGVEGAVVLSGRAKNPQDVGKATLLGFIVALVIYMLLSILPFGAMTQAELTQVATPSTSGVLASVVGDAWGGWLMSIGLMISVLVGWLAWTMLCAEIPMTAGENGAFPKPFAKRNKNGSANISLWVSSFIMQAAMLLVYFSNNAWETMYNICALMVVPAYFTTALFMVKLCITKEFFKYSKKGYISALIGGILGALFCGLILYASSIVYVLLIPILMTVGLPIFIWARKDRDDAKPIFEKFEYIYLGILIVIDILIILLFMNGVVKL